MMKSNLHGERKISPHVFLSAFVWGLGQLLYGQIVKGLLYLAAFAGALWFFIARGFRDIAGFFTLGTVQENLWLGTTGDNSMRMLILGLFALFALVFAGVIWYANVKDAAFTARQAARGNRPRGFRESLAAMADGKFHAAALVIPVVGVCLFSILPIVFMILIAFTNLGGEVVHPALADWSFAAWQKILSVGKVGATFVKILSWNVLWAVASTALNFFAGLSLALLLSKKNVRASKFWRSFPVVAYAVPAFISMLGFRFMFSQSGPINQMLTASGRDAVFFLSNVESAKWWARGIGLFVYAWIMTPSIMLMTTGILSNISSDLYEAASIDGASPFMKFRRITLPFILFSLTPVLISQFVGNFNNFGIFFFLRGGLQSNYADYFLASDTDLLINWLYNLSVDNNYYAIGAAISLVIFVITAVLSLAVYVNSKAYKTEDTFR
ncbi:MAG: sugar ABC transporter permease [Firmicutes bacterium]|nr:sugar ABC transporter permease [Bacillota bacterium]